MSFPSADQIALAIVEACRLTGDGPVATCLQQQSRGRHIAFSALCEVFPEASKRRLARLTGYAKPETWSPIVQSAKRAGWWRDEWVDEVVGVLVADQYGDQAQ